MNQDDVKEIRIYHPMTLAEAFSLLPEYSPESVAVAYKNWVHEFYHHVGVFTNVRRVNYERLQWGKFCKENGYEANDYLIETQTDQRDWELFFDRTGMGNHLKRIREFQAAIAAMSRGINAVIDEELGDMLYAQMDRYWDDVVLPKTAIGPFVSMDALWFNSYINNPTQLIKELRSMPYDEYLKTPHWRCVRDAMIMLYGCNCQGRNCDMMGDSGYGGAESMIHVHHLTYENRGNERYEDLTLLCDRCHKQIHGIAS